MRTRWERDNRILVAIGLALGLALTGGYAVILRARALSPGAAANRVLLFVLFYIVVVLILVLVFVLGRSAVKLILEARRGVFGSRFRVTVVATHVGLALLPIALLLLPITGLLQKSVEFWFEGPVRETVHSGRDVAELVRHHAAERERSVAERLASSLGSIRGESAVLALLSSAREMSGLDFIEWRPAFGAPLAVSSPRWPVREMSDPTEAWLADAVARGSVRRVEQPPDGGQVGRTILASPVGLLITGTYDPPAEAGRLRTLTRASSAYAMLEAERASLKATQVLLFLLLAFLVLLAAVWAGLLLARRVTRPIAALAASARRVGAGDFNALVEVEGGDEIAALSSAFNAMTRELKTSRQEIESANAELAGTNRRLDEERNRIRTVLAHLDAGVLAFGAPPDRPSAPSAESVLLATNETARRFLRCGDESPPPGETLCGFLDAPWLAPMCEFLCRAFDGSGPREASLKLTPPGESEPRILEVRAVRVPGAGSDVPSWVVTMEETTALVKAERAAAWEEAARRMAHEIKNPLTPIRLAAERMRKRARAEARGDKPAGAPLVSVVEDGATAIVTEVGTLAGLVDAFGRFARLPAADLAPTDLAGVIQQVVKLYDGTKKGVAVTAEVPADLPAVRADAEQMKRALINLVDNAVSATPAGGCVRVYASVEDGTARLAVADDGPGIGQENRDRVFDPSFSTKPRGTGLGLAITARIAVEHAGRVRVEDNPPHGCRFVLEWPA
jgi:two-component system nitrogen regulation sensor histidine kinase NtrY